ncbi:MAG: bifunctional ornithine acetyltransferase/N-acetylglutamate synthase, partial [Candidatus Omnitrophica bacterium]|nr:bifunctional ornithine acetyltransferase/N-acetylglutamate synthase [Candidatus Omnitrophota bacterium]
GVNDTKNLCKKLAEILKVKEDNILIASTGIIGKKLPYNKIINKLPKLVSSLDNEPDRFSQSILTTDTFKKIVAREIDMGGKRINVLGIAKGAGMIAPNLATMLAFILTDAGINKKIFREICKRAIEASFNSITIDGCMSTNDSVYFLANSYVKFISRSKEINDFSYTLSEVCLELAKMIVKDGEGATKFVELNVKGAYTKKEAELAAKYIANSPLFKSALYGNNPNWGRIISALGHANIRVKENRFKVLASSLEKKEVKINVYLGRGDFSYTVYTSDLTPQYVKINAGYS